VAVNGMGWQLVNGMAVVIKQHFDYMNAVW
jgi:hypothetical protein